MFEKKLENSTILQDLKSFQKYLKLQLWKQLRAQILQKAFKLKYYKSLKALIIPKA
jgi:hypothetical protein